MSQKLFHPAGKKKHLQGAPIAAAILSFPTPGCCSGGGGDGPPLGDSCYGLPKTFHFILKSPRYWETPLAWAERAVVTLE